MLIDVTEPLAESSHRIGFLMQAIQSTDSFKKKKKEFLRRSFFRLVKFVVVAGHTCHNVVWAGKLQEGSSHSVNHS